jgi:response regulator RpfG family c-di-GMP phosphodiesterase
LLLSPERFVPLSKYFVELPLPTLEDNVSDLSRLLRGLRQRYQLRNVTVDFEVLKQLRQRGQMIPFIMVTSVGNERLAVEALKFGATDYVVKDASYDTVLPQVIERALVWSRNQKEQERLEAERNGAVEALRQEKVRLEQMNAAMLGREERVLELKDEVNKLLEELGRPKKYTTYTT